jgi:hypothetical protein
MADADAAFRRVHPIRIDPHPIPSRPHPSIVSCTSGSRAESFLSAQFRVEKPLIVQYERFFSRRRGNNNGGYNSLGMARGAISKRAQRFRSEVVHLRVTIYRRLRSSHPRSGEGHRRGRLRMLLARARADEAQPPTASIISFPFVGLARLVRCHARSE